MADQANETRPLLQMQGVVKAFPGVKALDGVNFELRAGEIHTLMGENGAGKSTLIKVLTGVHPCDEGQITLDGKLLDIRTPLQAQIEGISTVYQEVNLVPNLTVAENIGLGRFPMKAGKIDWTRLNNESKQILNRLGLDVDPRDRLGSCSIAIQQMIAIARALQVKAKVLVLDEPTSSLDAGEVEQLFTVMRRLRDEGLGIVFVSHFLDQVYAISDRFTVLRNGKLVGVYDAPTLPRISLISKMLGRAEDEIEKIGQSRSEALTSTSEVPSLQATHIGKKRMLNPLDIEVRAGEVVGLAGLLGSGRTELTRLLFGLDKPDTGQVSVAGTRYQASSPRKAIRAGIGLVPEDRKVEGIIPNLSVRENIALALQAKRGWLRPLSKAAQNELADKYIKALQIATPSAETPIGKLSGGNQQKVILARWLAAQPNVLILDEPTRGVDVGAKAEIEALTGQLCKDGLAILLIASDLEEVTRTSHRVVVLRDRKKIGELEGDNIEVGAIMQMIVAEDEAK